MSKKNRKQKHLWFKAKTYGWGWYPITWQGWAITALFTLLYIASGIAFGAFAPAVVEAGGSVWPGIALFLSGIIFITVGLLYICYRHGEPPRWRWGK